MSYGIITPNDPHNLEGEYDFAYVIPNLKTGTLVDVTFTGENPLIYQPHHETSFYYLGEARDRSNPLRGGSTNVEFLVRGKADPPRDRVRWGWLDNPEANPMGKGYGLCLYLAAAMLGRDLGFDGIAAGAVCNYSWALWVKLYQHGLAECDGAPAARVVTARDGSGEWIYDPAEFYAALDKHDMDVTDYETPCALPGDVVARLVAKWRPR